MPREARAPRIDVHAGPVGDLRGYTSIHSRFEASSELDVLSDADGGIALFERATPARFHKDYDAVEDPLHWPQRFDVSLWAQLAALRGGERVGGAVVAFGSPRVDLLEGRDDLAVLWDIRVAAAAARTGVGSALVAGAEAWARANRCRELKVETQNTNVAACRFYASRGFRLAEANRGVYPAHPREIQLLWRKSLA